jgi:hypothetical protein
VGGGQGAPVVVRLSLRAGGEEAARVQGGHGLATGPAEGEVVLGQAALAEDGLASGVTGKEERAAQGTQAEPGPAVEDEDGGDPGEDQASDGGADRVSEVGGHR